MASTKDDESPSPKAKTKKKDWSTYVITPSFRQWVAPILDNSYGALNAEKVLQVLIQHNLADEVLPLIEEGIQPMSEHGPIARYQTRNHRYESNTIEYLEIKNLCFGRPKAYRPPEPGPKAEVEAYNVSKMHDPS